MSKDLTDVDQYSSPIRVPVGTDSRDDAAGDVELIAQRLANRTHHLNQHAAKKDVANTFTADQTINGKLIASEVVTPTISSAGSKVTINDAVDINGTFRVIGNASYLAGAISTGVIFSELQVLATKYIRSDEYVSAPEFRYNDAPERTVRVPILGWNADFGGAGIPHLAPQSQMIVDLPLPFGAKLTRARIKIGSGDFFFQGGRTKCDMNATTSPGTKNTNFDGDDTGHATGISIWTCAFNSDNASNTDADITADGCIVQSDMQFYVTLSNQHASAHLEVFGIDMTFIDPGPRNH